MMKKKAVDILALLAPYILENTGGIWRGLSVANYAELKGKVLSKGKRMIEKNMIEELHGAIFERRGEELQIKAKAANLEYQIRRGDYLEYQIRRGDYLEAALDLEQWKSAKALRTAEAENSARWDENKRLSGLVQHLRDENKRLSGLVQHLRLEVAKLKSKNKGKKTK